MSITMHSASAPAFIKMLGNMLRWLDAAKAHAESRKFDSSVYLTMRLAPDMLPFTKQIQIASDAAKGCMARLSGREVPAWEDKEASLDELAARIQRTIDFVASVPAAELEGCETREIVIPRRSGEPLRFQGEHFLRHWSLPNFYFHVGMTYALLRHAGGNLGKADYLGQ